ncbi:MAG: hypothetical protein H0X50_11270, partial [Nitrosopumilus sp.]|nr:hypothetical protein [Nitrosopumilus sp.]
FVNSSNAMKSKILQAAIEIDEDYREYIQNRDRGDKIIQLKNKEDNQKSQNSLLFQ